MTPKLLTFDMSKYRRYAYTFTSFHALHNAIKLESSSSLANEDLFPSPPEKRTWTAFNFFAYW